jgi:nucleotide sugar dehydrogenase
MKHKNINVSVIGVGYIGTVISCALASEAVTINGIDLDDKNIDLLNKGQTHIHEPGVSKKIKEIVNSGFFSCSSNFSTIADSSVIIVTVGTPLSSEFEADLSQVENVAKNIGKSIAKNTLICLKSTVIPGTTERFSEIIAKESGLEIGNDVHIAFSPERIAEGKALDEINHFPIVIGSNYEESTEICSKFWETYLGVDTIQVSSFSAAELTKLADNLWIDTNIALANLISSLAYKLGANSNEIIDSANTLPKGSSYVNILRSSIGVGGSCLTKDPLFFANLLDANGIDSSMIRDARKVNESMPSEYINLMREWLNKKDIQRPQVAIIGLSFKADTNDLRYTPMTEIYNNLKQDMDLRLHDPFVKKENFENLVGEEINFLNLHDAIMGSDVILFGCSHSDITEHMIEELLPSMNTERLIVDGRSGYAGLTNIVGSENYISI